MYKIELKIKKYATITVYTNYENLKDIFDKDDCPIKRTIPISDIVISNINNGEIELSNAIIINDSNLLNMEFDKINNVAMLYAKEKDIRIADITYIALSMFSNILQDDNKYLIHSSAINYHDNNAFLLVGEANAGKTSLAYQLIDKYKYKLISNDHSLIGIENGNLKLYTGTKEIQMRLGAIKLYFPELFKKININADDIWEKKIIVNDYIDKELIGDDTDLYNLTDIYSISTYNTGDSFLRKKEPVDELLFIYESISRIIKGTYNYIIGFNYPMPALEKGDSLQRLANNCKLIADQCNVFVGKGTINDLSKSLVKKYER